MQTVNVLLDFRKKTTKSQSGKVRLIRMDNCHSSVWTSAKQIGTDLFEKSDLSRWTTATYPSGHPDVLCLSGSTIREFGSHK